MGAARLLDTVFFGRTVEGRRAERAIFRPADDWAARPAKRPASAVIVTAAAAVSLRSRISPRSRSLDRARTSFTDEGAGGVPPAPKRLCERFWVMADYREVAVDRITTS